MISAAAPSLLRAYPPMSVAAAMLGVAPSTLSRLPDLEFEPMGGRDKRIPARGVLRLEDHFRKQGLNVVAAALLDHARQQAPEAVDAVREEIDGYFRTRTSPATVDLSDFLQQARRLLPAPLYVQVERACRPARGGSPLLRGFVSETVRAEASAATRARPGPGPRRLV